MSSQKYEVMNAVEEVEARSTKSSKYDNSHLFTALLFAVFVLMLLLAIISGTNVYKSLRSLQISANDTRLGVSLIANTVRSNDAVSSVAVGEGPEGRSLVLREVLESGTYETRIYLYKGNIVEEYTLEGSAYRPDNAEVIVASKTFDFAYKDGLLTINCDQGSADVALRSLKGGA